MNSKKKTLHQKLIDDPGNETQVNDKSNMTSFPYPNCSSVEKRFKNMSEGVKDVKLEESGIVSHTPFSFSGDKAVYHVREGDPDEWKTIKVLSLKTLQIIRTFLLFDPKSDEPEVAEASFEHFSQIAEVKLDSSSPKIKVFFAMSSKFAAYKG